MKTKADWFIQPLLSEKSSRNENLKNEFTLVVNKDITKVQIKAAVEKVFGVKPLDVRTSNFRKKSRRTRFGVVPASSFKKALIRLPEGKKIEVR